MNNTIVPMSTDARHTFGYAYDYAYGYDEEDDGVLYGYDFSDGVLSCNVWVGATLVRAA